MFGVIKKAFISSLNFSGSIVSLFKVSERVEYTSLNKQPWITRPTLINLNYDKYSQGLHYYPFSVKIVKCNGSWNSFNDFADKICVRRY